MLSFSLPPLLPLFQKWGGIPGILFLWDKITGNKWIHTSKSSRREFNSPVGSETVKWYHPKTGMMVRCSMTTTAILQNNNHTLLSKRLQGGVLTAQHSRHIMSGEAAPPHACMSIGAGGLSTIHIITCWNVKLIYEPVFMILVKFNL